MKARRSIEQELAHRTNDGLEVTLLWRAIDDRLRVVVEDWKAGDWFQVEAEPDAALDVFYHPYAYAAPCGVEYRADEPSSPSTTPTDASARISRPSAS
jgi:hypothetical protein